MQDILIPSPESYTTSVNQKQATGPAQIERKGLHKGMTTDCMVWCVFWGRGSSLKTIPLVLRV